MANENIKTLKRKQPDFNLLSGAKIPFSPCDHSLAVMARKRTVDRVELVTEP